MLKSQEDYDQESYNNSEDSYEPRNRSHNKGEDSQGRITLEENTDFFQRHGMFFCSTCKNLMDPAKTRGEILEFSCRRCGSKLINFRNRQMAKCMVMSKSLKSSSNKTELQSKLIFDPSMPIMSVQCPECGYDQAVYVVVPEEGERRIMVNLICARGAKEGVVKCDTKWTLRQDVEIDEEDDRGALKEKTLIEEEGEIIARN